MIKVRLLSGRWYPELAYFEYPTIVEARICDRADGIEVHQSSFHIIFSKETTTNNGWVFFGSSQKQYELITEENPEPQQQTIEQLLVTRNKHKDDIEKKKIMIIDIDTEIIDRLAPIGYSIAVFK